VAEVVLTVLACDPTSYFNASPGFDPGAGYRMGDFLLWADAIDPRARVKPPEAEEPADPADPADPVESTRDAAATDTAADRDAAPADLDLLLEYLLRTRNFDLGGYKRAGLVRRVLKRMRMVGIASVPEYIAHLEAHPDEYVQFLDTLLINVTAFFRDDVPWDYLRAEILPRLVRQKEPGEPIRVWCAGCATGQEAYTLAIVLAEQLGLDAFRERVKIYATDLDMDALGKARQAAYGDVDLADVPEALRERYFERQDNRWQFRKDLRRQVIFGRNDLLQDAPISRIDLLSCRNTLMYFDSTTQAKILARFHFALNDDGVLFLGRAETLMTHNRLFAPLDLRRRIFAKVPRGHGRDRQFMAPRNHPGYVPTIVGGDSVLHEQAFDVAPTAQFVVDSEGRMAVANARARALFQLAATDMGRPLQDLKVSYQPLELRSLLDQAYAEMRPITRTDVPWRAAGGDQRWYEIVVAPLVRALETPDGASVSFTETTRQKLLRTQVEESQAELESAYQELQSTNEELETTNEELHSTVEELETTNEELQSTNEELETMNEELQSTNEELQTINDELRLRSDEFNRVNAFLESVFASLRSGVVVLDRELRVLVWNSRAEDLWGLRADEVEQAHFLNLDIGLPLAPLVEPLRASLGGSQPTWESVLPATNRRGRAIECRVTVMPLHGRLDDRPQGVIVLMHDPATGAASNTNALAPS
jgi:two-component system CheB/CheR fusion protein